MDSHRWSRQRRKARALTLSALVEANTTALPSMSEGTSKKSSSNYDALQVTVARPRNLADDMQAEARAMTRAAAASVYTPEMLATKYGSRPIRVQSYVVLPLACLFFPLRIDYVGYYVTDYQQ